MAEASHLNQAALKTARRKLQDYVSEISEHADVRAGSPWPSTPSRAWTKRQIIERSATGLRAEASRTPHSMWMVGSPRSS
jgi:hypothetical protein